MLGSTHREVARRSFCLARPASVSVGDQTTIGVKGRQTPADIRNKETLCWVCRGTNKEGPLLGYKNEAFGPEIEPD